MAGRQGGRPQRARHGPGDPDNNNNIYLPSADCALCTVVRYLHEVTSIILSITPEINISAPMSQVGGIEAQKASRVMWLINGRAGILI